MVLLIFNTLLEYLNLVNILLLLPKMEGLYDTDSNLSPSILRDCQLLCQGYQPFNTSFPSLALRIIFDFSYLSLP